MQELPKGEAVGYSAMIRYRALLKKNVLFPSISLAEHISWIKQIFFNTEFSFRTTCPHWFNDKHTYQS